MIKRIVMMELLPGEEDRFWNIFETVKHDIRRREGCVEIEALRSVSNGQISVWTISVWLSENALDAYRASDLFKKTWSAVKPLFSAKAQAWTLTSIEKLS